MIRRQRDRDNKITRKPAFTGNSANVQLVTHGTFTAERAVCVDTLAINTRVIDAFINIYKKKHCELDYSHYKWN